MSDASCTMFFVDEGQENGPDLIAKIWDSYGGDLSEHGHALGTFLENARVFNGKPVPCPDGKVFNQPGRLVASLICEFQNEGSDLCLDCYPGITGEMCQYIVVFKRAPPFIEFGIHIVADRRGKIIYSGEIAGFLEAIREVDDL